MVGWLIVLGILALLLGLLLSPFSFAWDYDAPKDRFFWKLSWLGISFADSAGKGLFQREKEESRKIFAKKPYPGIDFAQNFSHNINVFR